ncbi:DUF222 domain-containing protein [Nocardioides sp. JQ2195]|uniref:HNH endonuclease n=1 Tax=Nocardioides sp. JQ2195 TaxID=2592334 RepID=UPI00143ED19D|nr:HNH endonuclease signature motif containing protein [Nocardioides sp. JQ2195]QIX25545.1 DUF222 domain-containing protein [Nocardioides sp. JQ2195]
MFDSSHAPTLEQAAPVAEERLDASTVAAWTEASSRIHVDAHDDTARIDAINAIEVLKCALAAAQADLAVDFDESMRQKAADQGIAKERQGRGIAEQIGLARRESGHRGQRHLGLAKVLRSEMPYTLAAFRTGRITEWGATRLAQETACLEVEDRATIDAELAGDPQKLEKLSEKEIGDQARKRASQLDPASVARRRAKAEKDRRVSIRPAPDTMTFLTGHLPVGQGVAVFASLRKAADAAILDGDERNRGQIMADTLVERVTGQTTAPATPVAVTLVVANATLLGDDNAPAHLDGHGSIPADLARSLVGNSLAADLKTWIRKLYADRNGRLIGMENKSRLVPKALANVLRLRDGGFCRNLWCDAPIRHIDHATGAAVGGPTSAENLQGLCEACNYAKQAPGWSAAGSHPPDERHQVTTVTPTGHRYTATAPPLPTRSATPPRLRPVTVEIHHRPDLKLDFAA